MMSKDKIQTQKTPVVIIGSGIAGLLTALKLAENKIHSTVVSKTLLAENSSRMAQGGIAAVLPNNPDDSLLLHLKDTLDAGAGLSNRAVAKSILQEGFQAIEDLVALGVPFDRDKKNKTLELALEGAHSARRIVHAGGDSTGRTVQDTLIQRVHESSYINVLEQCFVKSLLTDDSQQCIGLLAVQKNQKSLATHSASQLQWIALHAQRVVLATGGVGQLYSQSTNPPISTGDGVALAYRAGAAIQDVEFIQFHPTAFWAHNGVHFLISEALRGEGGILRNASGSAFAKKYHPKAELAPRDVVSRMILTEIKQQLLPHVYLDMTHLPGVLLENRFPSILKLCLNFGIDIRRDWIPVAPASHYWMGGVKVDAEGRSTIENLYAVGEVACTGLHGANRLASNSLLECLVLARRVADDIGRSKMKKSKQSICDAAFESSLSQAAAKLPKRLSASGNMLNIPITQLRQLMWDNVGIVRSAESLEMAQRFVQQTESYARQEGFFDCFPAGFEYENMLLTARLIIGCALARKESRGAHFRSDYLETQRKALHSLCDPQVEIAIKNSLDAQQEIKK